jgi:signal transduction histidine kinase
MGIDRPIMHEELSVVLFDLDKDRVLSSRREGWYRFSSASSLLDCPALRDLGATEGVIAQVLTGGRRGWLILWNVADLSVDFLELGVELGRVAGAVIDHDSLLSAIEEGAAARTRLSLARDVHDSVVQFLAGAAFRVEAMMRGARSGRQVDSDLMELKRLLIEEQGEIRAFVAALRRDRELELAESVEELKGLARRLGEQWSVDCRIEASNDDDASIPIRLQLDMQQLLREAVANAVRHGGASRIDIGVGVAEDRLRIEVKDNGIGFGPKNGSPVEPWSLKERVDRAHGSLSLQSEPGCTNILITLPLTGVAA